MIAHADEYPVIVRIRDDYAMVTFGLVHDLVKAHNVGDVTFNSVDA